MVWLIEASPRLATTIASLASTGGHLGYTLDDPYIHLALAEDPEVETRSEGEGFLKRVAVRPKAS